MVPVISEVGKASGRNNKCDFALVFPYLFENVRIFLVVGVRRAHFLAEVEIDALHF